MNPETERSLKQHQDKNGGNRVIVTNEIYPELYI